MIQALPESRSGHESDHDDFETVAPSEQYFDPLPWELLLDEIPAASPMADMLHLVKSRESFIQPAFRFGAALAWMSAITGRKIGTANLRTNLYLVAVAGTARGKDAAYDSLLTIDEESKGPEEKNLTMSLAHSDMGLMQSLVLSPSRLSVVDEWGRVLSGILNPAADSGNKRLVTMMLKLATSADKRVQSEAYADPTKNREVNQPCWSLYGLATPRSFVDGLNTETLEGGMLPRMLVLIGHPNPDMKEKQIGPVPPSLVAISKAWREWVPGGNRSMLDWRENPKPANWPFDPDASERVKDMERIWRESFMAAESAGFLPGLLYSRAAEQMKKVALILAANRHGPTDKGSISSRDVEAGIRFVDYSVGNFIRLIGNRISDTEHGRRVAAVLDFVRRYGSEGVPVHLARSNFNHLPQNLWGQILDQLCESRQIHLREGKSRSGKGRPSKRIFPGYPTN